MKEHIVAIIPIRGSDEEFRQGATPLLGGKPLIEYTLLAAKESRRLDRCLVSTDSEAIAEFCRGYGIEAPFLRPATLSGPTATVTDVLSHAVDWLRGHDGYQVDWVVKLEITHPFRPPGFIDLVIDTALAKQVDSAFVAYNEVHSYWTLDEEGKPQQVGEDIDVPRKVRRPFFRDVSGLVALTRLANLDAGRFYGSNVGLIPLRDLFAIVDTHEGTAPSYRERTGFRLADLLASEFQKVMEMEGSR